MRNQSDRLSALLKLLPACAIAGVGTQALAQSNCVNGPAGAAAANLTDLTIDPCTISTDPLNCQNPTNEPHRIFWNPALLPANVEDELVVILPGGAQDPRHVEWLGKAAAYAGYRAIILAYEGDDLEAACGTATGAAHSACTRDFRKDVILGTPAAPAGATDVHRANSAELRLLDLLADLNADPVAGPVGWNQYLNGAALSHDKITISGYSLGSGHAAYWASLEKFAGVVTISGPTDSSCVQFQSDRTLHPGLFYPLGCTNTLAAWIRENAATPGTSRYGAFHAQEAVFPKLDVIIRAWDNFGLPRLPGNHLVLDVTNGYDFALQQPWPLTEGEHRFSFNTQLLPACTAHQAAAADSCLELDPASGLPLVFPLYMNMYCAAGGDLP